MADQGKGQQASYFEPSSGQLVTQSYQPTELKSPFERGMVLLNLHLDCHPCSYKSKEPNFGHFSRERCPNVSCPLPCAQWDYFLFGYSVLNEQGSLVPQRDRLRGDVLLPVPYPYFCVLSQGTTS